MPRSSRHKSSKHSSRDAREYSDSEKESSFSKERGKGGKEESSARVSKDSGGDKRKHDSKEYYDSVNGGEYVEEYSSSSSKRRKEKVVDESVSDRWNGGGEDERGGESSRKSKASGEKSSRRRDEGEGEEMLKKSGSSSKGEGKHRESSRRESREFDRDRERDRERKHKEGKAERYVDGEDLHGSKMASDKTDLNAQDQLQSPESENYLERRATRKKDDYGDGDKHQDSTGEFGDRHLSSVEDIFKDGKQKDEKYKDEKYRDKYREEVDRDSKHRGDKQKDDRSAREYGNARADEKVSRDEKDGTESRRKKSKLQDDDHDHDHDHDHDQDHGHEPDSELEGYHDRSRDYERNRDQEREHDRGRNRDRERDRDQDRDRRDYERDRYHERDWDRDRSRDRDWDLDRDRNRDRDKDRNRDHYYDRDRSKGDRERDLDRDDDQSMRCKDSRGRKRSPDDQDDLSDPKSRPMNAPYPDMETKNSRLETDGDRLRSQSRQASSSHGGLDEFRHMSEQRPKAISSREVTHFSGGSERGSKHRSSEKPTKMEDGHLVELSVERSSSSKASPKGLVERSPSSTSLERRYMGRSNVRHSLEIDETGLRNSAREFSGSEDRLSRDLPSEKPLADDTSQMEFSYKASQSNSSFPPRPDSRGGVGSPRMGSVEEDNRVNISSRHKRAGDPNLGRGQGNAWRGPPNWPSPVPNGFIPFQHGPPHGGFPSMMPQFPTPSLFGVRPSMEMNHPGIPYMSDAERFSSHLRPLGWQNMMDSTGPSHMHGWDVSNGVFRDEPHMYGGPDWDHNRNRMHGRGWESGADTWKGQNGDANLDVSSISQKDDYPVQAPDDDVSTGQTARTENNHLGVREKSVEARSNVTSPANELTISSPKVLVEKTADHPTITTDDDVDYNIRHYVSKLDISVELTDPELHSQFMSLLVKEQSQMADEEIAVLVNLKDDGKAVPKSSSSLLTTILPSSNNSVFQRAMDLYKKLRVEVKGCPPFEDGKFELPVSNEEKADDQGALHDMEKGVEAAALIPGANTSNVLISTSPKQEAEGVEGVASADNEMIMDEHVSAPSPEAECLPNDLLNELQVPSQNLICDRSEEPTPVLNGSQMNALTTKETVLEDVGGDQVSSPNDVSHSAACMDTGGDGLSQKEHSPENKAVQCVEERQGCGDATDSPLDFLDASPKVSGSLVPESHESGSVISRIHLNPENTH